ncbi:MAG TPA: histidine phosphatase family protein [Polyangia bacterium]|nr:histidine phosphatase family protein [Polyangia bacterium]
MGRVLYLARHGETDWNRDGRWQGHTDVALNDAGRAQARALAEKLRGAVFARVHTSDLLRARETAEIVRAILGAGPLVVDRDLRERSFGLFEGLTRDECQARHPEHWAAYRADVSRVPPGAEAHDALGRRMEAAVARAGETRDGEGDGAVLVVSHGGSIRALVARATGAMPPPLANTAVFRAVFADGALTDVTMV